MNDPMSESMFIVSVHLLSTSVPYVSDGLRVDLRHKSRRLLMGLCGQGKREAALQLLSVGAIIPRLGPAHQRGAKLSFDHNRLSPSQVQLLQLTGKPWP